MKIEAAISAAQNAATVGNLDPNRADDLNDVVGLYGVTGRQEVFAQALAETGNQSLAYRRAYRPSINTKPGVIWTNGYNVARLPQVAARTATIREDMAKTAVANRNVLVAFLWRRILADRRQLINHVRRCCRYCYGGERHQYQWKDELEYALECAKILDANMAGQGQKHFVPIMMPTDEGGYGFDPHREPEPTCDSQHCMGDGSGKTVIVDTTTLQGDAALIYEGVKETAQGIEIKVADRNADMLMLAKLQGWSIDKVEGTLAGLGAAGAKDPATYEIPAAATTEEVTRRYLAAVS